MESKDRNNQTQDERIKHDDTITEEYQSQNLSVVLLPYLQKLWIIRRKLLIINGSVFFISLIILLLFVKSYFDSTITILPDFGNKSMSLSALAEMAGVSLGAATQSPTDIYQNLLMSESVIGPAIYARYRTKKYSDSVNLLTYFEIEPDTDLPEAVRERKMFLKIYKEFTKWRINALVDPMTKILTVRVRMPESQLSADVANILVQSLDTYVRTKRKSNAIDQRTYIEKRLAAVKDSLRDAENELKNFQIANRTLINSPNLLIIQSHLNLELQILQGNYSDLTHQLEVAKIDEIRDAPIVNESEWAKQPFEKAGPPRLLILFGIIVISSAFSIAYYLNINKVKKFIKKIGDQ